MMMTAQPLPDDKGPLKGKGGALAQWRGQVQARLEQHRQAMSLLAQQTRDVQWRRFSLTLHKQRGQALQLRWRMGTGQHTVWARVLPLLAELPPTLAQWYAEQEEAAVLLNHQEQVLRHELKTVERLMRRSLFVAGASAPVGLHLEGGSGQNQSHTDNIRENMHG